MSGGKGKVEPALVVRVSSLGDLVRLAGTLASRMIVMPVYRVRVEGGSVWFLQMMYKDYYKYYGIPVVYVYFWEGDDRPPSKTKYILAKSDETGEKIEVSDRTRGGWLVVPVINLDGLPEFIQLEDLQQH